MMSQYLSTLSEQGTHTRHRPLPPKGSCSVYSLAMKTSMTERFLVQDRQLYGVNSEEQKWKATVLEAAVLGPQ